MNKLPVILSSSCTGLLISYSLTKRGIAHVLIGGPKPDDTPKLGESMNEAATFDCWKWLDEEFRQFFYPKCHISLMHGDIPSMIYLNDPKSGLDARAKRMVGNAGLLSTADSLIHVDRIGFDQLLYDRMRQSKYCQFVEDAKAQPVYDGDSDQFTSIQLSDGKTIESPSYVFDATGPRCLLGGIAGVGRSTLSAPERVVWRHYYADKKIESHKRWWLYGTNLLRLDISRDSIDGIAWLIPLGDTLSLGYSIESENCAELSENELIKLLEQAFIRRGLDFLSVYPRARTEIADLATQYFVCDKAYGSNWLLAGASFIQAWFPSSSGMSTSTAAAHFAPLLLEEPSLAARYEENLRSLLPFHNQIHRMIKTKPFEHRWQAFEFWSEWLALIPPRLFNHLYAIAGDPSPTVPKYGRLASISQAMVTRPLLQLVCWGFFAVRAKKIAQLDQQINAYTGYFQMPRFRLHNYWGGWGVYLSSKWKSRQAAAGSETTVS